MLMRIVRQEQLLRRLREADPAAVSTGTQETLDCLHEGRVLTLVADDSYATPGSHCRQCQRLFEAKQLTTCPICRSTDLETIDDLVESALQQALDRKGEIAFIRDPARRSAFAGMGPLRALLRY
ncbi:hypothetical protein RAD16_10170 [Bradyrhizobium sp. 18BD]